MIKKILAAMAAIIILLSLCACNAEKQPDDSSTQTSTTDVEVPAYPVLMSYEDYIKLTPAQQQAYYESFPDQQAYIQWYNAAALEYNQNKDEQGNKTEGNTGTITQPSEREETYNPEIPTQKPEDPTEEPEDPTQKPEDPTKKPEDPTQKPEDPTKKPEDPTQKPEVPTEKPETPTAGTPEKKDPVLLTYEEYLKLSPALQQAYCESFSSMDAFMQWFNVATREYNENMSPPQTENDEGQITQPTEQEQSTTPLEETTGAAALEGVGGVEVGRPPLPGED